MAKQYGGSNSNGRDGGGPPRGAPRASGGGAGGSGGPRSRGGFGDRSRAGPAPQARRPPPPRTLRIIHEDADLIVIDKPPGIVTANLMPSRPEGTRAITSRESIFDMVKEHVRANRRKRGEGRVWIIHRLDKEASGLLVFAKTERAYQWLKDDFRAKRVHRLYIAVVEGTIGEQESQGAAPPESEAQSEGAKPKRRIPKQLPAGTIQSFILEGAEGESARSLGLGEVARGSAPPPGGGRMPAQYIGGEGRGARGGRIGRGSARFEGDEGSGEARLAVTHYRVLAIGQGRSLLQLRLETGRKNQIRVHLQEFGRPIVGDYRYGGTTNPIARLCLHATELGFTNPASGQTMRFTSPPPPAFYGLVGMEPPAAAEQAMEERLDPSAARPKSSAKAPAPPPASVVPAADTSWDNVADWYDAMVEDERSDHFQQVILPGAIRLLKPTAGMRILDVACGQGALCRQLVQLDAEAVGIDASPRLIEAARRRSKEMNLDIRYEVGDARQLESMREALGAGETDGRPFDAILTSMALMNIDPLEPVLRGCASLLKPGGALVAIILHPAFRSPRQTSWAWGSPSAEDGPPPSPTHETRPRRSAAAPSEKPKRTNPTKEVRQYRRIDGYLSPGQVAITMNPGHAAHGAEEITTWTFHRPLQTYIKALADAGFLIEALEEWPSQRQSRSGPRAAEENRARREIPMFLGLRAVSRAD
jgi:23S rRNA-/tRNA-specific pseudouridylate synthase/ubiquinone/menaquinone biosynthesis C-methylase UbiE